MCKIKYLISTSPPFEHFQNVKYIFMVTLPRLCSSRKMGETNAATLMHGPPPYKVLQNYYTKFWNE